MLKFMNAEMKRNDGTTCINNLAKSLEVIEGEYMRRWREIELALDGEDIETHDERVEREHDKLYAEHRTAIDQFVEFAGKKMFDLARINNVAPNSKAAYLLWQVEKTNAPHVFDYYSFGTMLRRFYEHLSCIDTESDPWGDC